MPLHYTRVMFIRHKQKEILSINFSEVTYDEFLVEIKKARDIISQQPPQSIRILTNLKQLRVNKEMIKTFKEYIELNKPFVLACALFGVSEQTKVLFQTVIALAHRDIQIFDTEEQAKDWLAEQKEAPPQP